MERLLDDVSASLDRIRSEVVGGIESQLDAVMSKGEGLVNRLEAELGQLMDRRATLEVQAISQDHIGFLQVRRHLSSPLSVSVFSSHLFLSLSSSSPLSLSLPQSYEEATAPLVEEQQEVDEDEEFSLHFQLGDVRSALSEVKEKMDDIRMGEVRSRVSRGSGESQQTSKV